jgi:hypothetical protein
MPSTSGMPSYICEFFFFFFCMLYSYNSLNVAYQNLGHWLCRWRIDQLASEMFLTVMILVKFDQPVILIKFSEVVI